MADDRGLEAVEILDLRLAPGHLAESQQARQQHVFQLLRGGDVFGPEVDLRAEDMVLVLL